MACGCVDNSCACVVTGNAGITVSGAGSVANPYVVSGSSDTTWNGTNTDGGIVITPGGTSGHSPVINLNLDPASPAPLSVGPNGLSVDCCPNNVSALDIVSVDTLLTNSYETVLADTTLAPITITLPPAPVAGERYEIVDYGNGGLGNSSVFNITIGRNGNTIVTVASDLVIAVDGNRTVFIFDGIGNWF